MFSISYAIYLILYLGLILMSFFWLRQAYRVFIGKDYSKVALKGGESPANPERYAPWAGVISLVTGLVALWLAIVPPFWLATGVLLGPFEDYRAWAELGAGNLWVKIFADFILRRQAHPFKFAKQKDEEKAASTRKSVD